MVAGVAFGLLEVGADDLHAAAGGFRVVHHFGKAVAVVIGTVDVSLQELGEGFVGGWVADEGVGVAGAADDGGFAEKVEDDFGAAFGREGWGSVG